jgi:hypothetical protein
MGDEYGRYRVMSHDWGPHFIVPTEVGDTYSGIVGLRERLDEALLSRELQNLGLSPRVAGITNPWYCRKKGTDTWVKIGESDDKAENFPVMWDTRKLENGQYEVLGLMHVNVGKGDDEAVVARQSVVEITVEN